MRGCAGDLKPCAIDELGSNNISDEPANNNSNNMTPPCAATTTTTTAKYILPGELFSCGYTYSYYTSLLLWFTLKHAFGGVILMDSDGF